MAAENQRPQGPVRLVLEAVAGMLSSMNNHAKTTFIKEDPWRIFRIMAEFVDSFEILSQVGPGVTVFGSARILPSNPYYKATVELAKGLAQNNLAIITGGGPGLWRPPTKAGGKPRGGLWD